MTYDYENEGPFDNLDPKAKDDGIEGSDAKLLSADAVIALLNEPIPSMSPKQLATRDAYVREYDRLRQDEPHLEPKDRRQTAIMNVMPVRFT